MMPLACDLHEAPIERARPIRLLCLDVDGVLTDGRLFLSDAGEEYKVFHTHDGHGIKMLIASGVMVSLITGRSSAAVRRRAEELGIAHVVQGCQDKRVALEALLGENGLQPAQAAFVGDDVIDLPAMNEVGLAVSVADGHPFVRARAHWVTRNGGGRGAVREVCELIMHAQGTLDGLFDLPNRGACAWAGG
ncbi:MAG: 3-deoxy-manno-octulosonate-8-phosphatase KdsC [Gammaproteobacteria bacterium]|nr:3-deoxy-manno-octulosonate-8-phosphatase KdsC [Gammaproteobacteria bacterium]